MLFFPAQAEDSYFSADFRLKIFLYYSQIIAYDISVLDCIGVSIIVSAGFFVLLASLWNELKTYNCIVFTVFEHTKLYPFQNLCLGFILKIFFNFRKFQPLYSYKIYFYRKKLWSFKNLFLVLVNQCALVKVIECHTWLQRRLLYWQKQKENYKKIQKDLCNLTLFSFYYLFVEQFPINS